MIKLGKEFAHWVIEASSGTRNAGTFKVNVIANSIDRAVQICHEEHPNATIHAVRKSDRWDGAGLYVDLDPYGDEVAKDHPDLFRGYKTVEGDIAGVTDINPGDQP